MPARRRAPQPPPKPSFDAQSQVLALAEQTCRMVAIATAMVTSGRRMDMSGLQQSAGLLCAKALDLPRAEAGLARAELIRLVASLDALKTSMQEPRP